MYHSKTKYNANLIIFKNSIFSPHNDTVITGTAPSNDLSTSHKEKNVGISHYIFEVKQRKSKAMPLSSVFIYNDRRIEIPQYCYKCPDDILPFINKNKKLMFLKVAAITTEQRTTGLSAFLVTCVRLFSYPRP